MSYELIFSVKKASLFFINFILHSYYGFCSTLKSWGWATNVGTFHTNAPVLIMRLVSRLPRECCRRSHLVSQAEEITAVCHCVCCVPCVVRRRRYGGGAATDSSEDASPPLIPTYSRTLPASPVMQTIHRFYNHGEGPAKHIITLSL